MNIIVTNQVSLVADYPQTTEYADLLEVAQLLDKLMNGELTVACRKC